GTSWNWALNLTFYHAVISITIPMIWASLLLPRRYPMPWLGRKAVVALTLWMLGLCGALAYGVATTQFAAHGYTGPPLPPYPVAVRLTLAALLLGPFIP